MSEHRSAPGDGPSPRHELLDGPDVRPDGLMVDLFECGEDLNYIELQISDLAGMNTTSTWFPRELVTRWGNGDFSQGVTAARHAAYVAPRQLVESGFLGLPSQMNS